MSAKKNSPGRGRCPRADKERRSDYVRPGLIPRLSRASPDSQMAGIRSDTPVTPREPPASPASQLLPGSELGAPTSIAQWASELTSKGICNLCQAKTAILAKFLSGKLHVAHSAASAAPFGGIKFVIGGANVVKRR